MDDLEIVHIIYERGLHRGRHRFENGRATSCFCHAPLANDCHQRMVPLTAQTIPLEVIGLGT